MSDKRETARRLLRMAISKQPADRRDRRMVVEVVIVLAVAVGLLLVWEVLRCN